MHDTISIIVPIYNTGLYLEKCIESIIKQDYPYIEIIMVDDGSTDQSTIDICKNIEANNDNVYYYRKSNGGSASARNYGIQKAHGKYIGFVDSDDVIDSDMYSTLYSLIIQDRVFVSICGISIESNNKASQDDKEIKSGVYNNQTLMHHFLLGHWHSACTCLYEKSLFDKQSFPEGEVNEDYILNYQIFKFLPEISFTNKPYYHYIKRGASNTCSPKTLKFLDWIKHTSLILQEMSKNTSLIQEAEYQYLHSIIVLSNSALLSVNNVHSHEAKQLYDIVAGYLKHKKKMLFRNKFLTCRLKLMGFFIALTPSLYKVIILKLLKVKKIL